jgi:uncharacterized protein
MRSLFEGKAKVLILALAICLFIGNSTVRAQQPKALAMGTSAMGSAFYTLSVVMANVFTKSTGINVNVESVGGSDATIRGLAAKKVELAMLNANTAHDAYTGTGAYVKTGKVPIALIAQGQDSLRQIAVRNTSKIATPADLVGKKFIARRKANQEMEVMANYLLEAYGIDKKKVKIIETVESNESAEALKIGTVDAAILPGGLASSYLLDLFHNTDLTLLQIPDDKLDWIIKKLGPAFHKTTIPAGTYKGQNRDVKVPAMSSIIACRADLPEETVYKITKAIFTNYNEIKAGHSSGADWTLKNTLKDEPIPFHPGSIRYFKEIGAWGKK